MKIEYIEDGGDLQPNEICFTEEQFEFLDNFIGILGQLCDKTPEFETGYLNIELVGVMLSNTEFRLYINARNLTIIIDIDGGIFVEDRETNKVNAYVYGEEFDIERLALDYLINRKLMGDLFTKSILPRTFKTIHIKTLVE
jgi:hypothetical protein